MIYYLLYNILCVRRIIKMIVAAMLIALAHTHTSHN